MAQIESHDDGGGKKVRSKKNSTKVDMAPLVDLGFLLITFFMFAATSIKPNVMNLNMPPKIDVPKPTDIPDVILINGSDELESRTNIIEKCHLKGQPYANVSGTLFSKLAIGTTGYSAQDSARELLYQYTNYDESISISSVPIYYLDVNSRITVNDKASGIYGDYIIKSISLPLDAKSNMSISASRALERI